METNDRSFTEDDMRAVIDGSAALDRAKQELRILFAILACWFDDHASEVASSLPPNERERNIVAGQLVGAGFRIMTKLGWRDNYTISVLLIPHDSAAVSEYRLDVPLKAGPSLPRELVLPLRAALPEMVDELVKLFPGLGDELKFYQEVARFGE